MFTLGLSDDDQSLDGCGAKARSRDTVRVSRSGTHWPRRLGVGGSLLLLLSLFILVHAVPALAAAGQVTEFPVAQGFPGTEAGFPGNAMVLGSDGNIWFTSNTFNARLLSNSFIGLVTPSGQISEFGTPTAVSDPQDIATGSDHNLWFNEDSAHAVGRITTH
jgi:streptogramin lyase